MPVAPLAHARHGDNVHDAQNLVDVIVKADSAVDGVGAAHLAVQRVKVARVDETLHGDEVDGGFVGRGNGGDVLGHGVSFPSRAFY